MTRKSLLIIVFIFLSICGCKKEDDKNKYSNLSRPDVVLYIYGGRNEEDYLGKLNAGRYDSESIWNQYGAYGNKYHSKCIWNVYGTYGSEYSAYSPFNDYASNPPVLRDRAGNFYGYFTSNKNKANRADYGIIDAICDNHEKIGDDVGEWYDIIFR